MLKRARSAVLFVLIDLTVVLFAAQCSTGATISPEESRPLPKAASADRLAVGVQFKGMWSDYSDQERIHVLDTLAAAGVDSVRIDVSWIMLQPDGPDSYSTWGTEFVDRVIAMAHDRGLDPLVTLWQCPDWANGGRGKLAPPSDSKDFERVSRWAADRWQGKVAAWEIWNEPNSDASMTGADPAAYVDLLKAGYRGFKAGAPNTPVVFAGTSYVDAAWVEKAYEAGAAGYFDVMGTHPYQGVADAPPETADDGGQYTVARVANLTAVMAAHGDEAKPIWFTEFGWSSHANSSETPIWARGVSPEVQGDYLVRTLLLVQSTYPQVTRAYWYTDRDLETGDLHQDSFGLLTHDLRPKPALDALAGHLATR